MLLLPMTNQERLVSTEIHLKKDRWKNFLLSIHGTLNWIGKNNYGSTSQSTSMKCLKNTRGWNVCLTPPYKHWIWMLQNSLTKILLKLFIGITLSLKNQLGKHFSVFPCLCLSRNCHNLPAIDTCQEHNISNSL